MENSTNLESTPFDQDDAEHSDKPKSQRNASVFLIILAVFCMLLLAIGLTFGKHQSPIETGVVIEPTVTAPQLFPTDVEQENVITDWQKYSLGMYSFRLPKTFVQQIESTSLIATRFNSSSTKSLSIHMILEGSGFGIECADKIQTDEVNALGKKVVIDVFQGIKPGKSEMCSFDSSDTFWFQANLTTDDIVAMTFKDTEIDYAQAKRLFDQILNTLVLK